MVRNTLNHSPLFMPSSTERMSDFVSLLEQEIMGNSHEGLLLFKLKKLSFQQDQPRIIWIPFGSSSLAHKIKCHNPIQFGQSALFGPYLSNGYSKSSETTSSRNQTSQAFQQTQDYRIWLRIQRDMPPESWACCKCECINYKTCEHGFFLSHFGFEALCLLQN